ncbi:MAG: hypothetical protein AAF471_09040, partial [Myxococcota bacterium]
RAPPCCVTTSSSKQAATVTPVALGSTAVDLSLHLTANLDIVNYMSKRLSVIKQPIFSLLNDHIVDYPSPSNIKCAVCMFGQFACASVATPLLDVSNGSHWPPNIKSPAPWVKYTTWRPACKKRRPRDLLQ